ncbi:MAG: hypothetical protein NNA30_08660 [Nitrospira sp.]|jgi:hypothetical protein|nr:hypothetical protein [Nitrospira sp.]
MTPAEAAAALLRMMPPPLTTTQLDEYGISVSEADLSLISREILSLNLYWILAAIDAHIPPAYRTAIREMLLRSIKATWWDKGFIGSGTWEDYLQELEERRARYGYLVDYEGMSHMAVSAETASLIEDHGFLSSEEDRNKLLVLLIDYAPAAHYGKLLEEAG